jgi:phage terminase Nu1 subunit (DNA packaging protein)
MTADGKAGKAGNARARFATRGGLADYARHRGVTKKAVYDAVRRGSITVPDDGIVDFEQADAQWAANVTPEPAHLKASRAAEPDGEDRAEDGGESRNAAETRKARAAADLAEIKARQAAGELVPARQVELDAYDAGRIVRDRVLSVPARVAALVGAAPDDATRRRIMDRELRRALNDAADEIEAAQSAREVVNAEDHGGATKGDTDATDA